MSARLTGELARRLARIGTANVVRAFPHKLDHLLSGPEEALDHRRLHPAFYGSYDWHSAVHMHWLLARLGRLFPSPEIDAILERHLSPQAIAAELAYVHGRGGPTFERPYGWAWLLKLQAELAGTPRAAAVDPLAREIAARLRRFLAASYPVRAGSHGNTAFACLLALDYASGASAPRA